jgi:hypothetical protein
MSTLVGQTSERNTDLKDATKPALSAQYAPQKANDDKTVAEFSVEVWVFAGLSLITLIITLIRGIVPIELLEAALWAVMAWLWNKKSIVSKPWREVVLLFALLLAGCEGYLFGLHSAGPTPIRATNPSDNPTVPTTLGSIWASPPPSATTSVTSKVPNQQSTYNSTEDTTQSKHKLNGIENHETSSSNQLQEPDLSSLNGEEESSIEMACFLPKTDGPAAYIKCLNRQLGLLAKAPPYPDLSALSGDEESSIETACFLPKSDGPAAYNRCLTRQLRLLGIHPKATNAIR